MWDKLKERWGVQSNFDVIIILVVFACTGFSILYIKKVLFGLIGITPESSALVRWSGSLLIILPLYQVVLLIWGWIFGKFSFFWNFEKKTFNRITSLFKKNTN